MTIDPATFLAILAMASVTVLTRVSGVILVRHFELRGRVKRAFSAVPPAVLMAVVTPAALATGMAETLACAITALASLRLSLLPAAITGTVSVVLLRLVL